MTIEHELNDDTARIKVLGDLTSPRDVNLLIVIAGDYCKDVRCDRIEVDLSLSWKVSDVALGALSALEVMNTINKKSLQIVGAHGAVRELLQREGVLAAS